jgi:hypothetical protein
MSALGPFAGGKAHRIRVAVERNKLVKERTASGAPRTAPIAPPLCRPPPPAAVGHLTAPYGIALTASGIALTLAAFAAVPWPPHRVRCIYINPASLLRTTTHFLFPFPISLPSVQTPPRCTAPFFGPFSKMPRYPAIALFRHGAVTPSSLRPLSATGSPTGRWERTI